MTVGKDTAVIAELSSTKRGLAPIEGTPTTIVTTQTACSVSASLNGDEFSITALSPANQSFYNRSQIQWTWQVDPKDTGNLTLTLSLTSEAHTTVGIYTAEVEHKSVNIDVVASPVPATTTFKDVITSAWAVTIIGGVIVLLLAFIGSQIWNRRKNKGKTVSDPDTAQDKDTKVEPTTTPRG